MRKTKKILFLATVCTAVLFAMCTKSDDADITPNEVVAAGTASCPHPYLVIQQCPPGLYFSSELQTCVFPDMLPSKGSSIFLECGVCGQLIAGAVLRSSSGNVDSAELYGFSSVNVSLNCTGALPGRKYSELTVGVGGGSLIFTNDGTSSWTHTFDVFGLSGLTTLISFSADASISSAEFM